MFRIHPCRRFLGSRGSYEEARIVFFGVPFDQTSCRPGARFGPSQIRDASEVLEEFSLLRGKSLCEIPFYDLGDLELPQSDLSTSLKIIEDTTSKILSDGKIPAAIGGEHLISYPIVKVLKQKFNDLIVFDLDAHLDLRDSYSGMKYSHATVMCRIMEVIGPENLYQFGIRSGDKEELDYIQSGHLLPLSKKGFEEVLSRSHTRPVYITIDIDVVDPAFAPGVGTPEPGGPASRELLETLSELKTQQSRLNIVGFDLVELSPPYDPSSITAILCAKIIREILFLFKEKP